MRNGNRMILSQIYRIKPVLLCPGTLPLTFIESERIQCRWKARNHGFPSFEDIVSVRDIISVAGRLNLEKLQ